jgi:glycosyltransferase involved in cell wall biosynthesis
MKLAVCVTPENPCPPVDYGGNEKQADILVRKLIGLGHAVDLYCAPGSTCPATQRFETPNAGMQHESLFAHHIEWLSKIYPTYDCVIDMTANHLCSQNNYQRVCPSIAIMTGDPYKKYPHDKVRNRVYVSPQLAEHFGCGDWPVLHNIIAFDPCSHPLGRGGGGYALYLGAVRPEKGVHLAAKTCAWLGVKLIVAGPVQPRFRSYLDELQKWPCVEYIGPVNQTDKWKLLSDAGEFIYPVQWCDAGPLGVMEALLVGTPVVGIANGGICQDVQDGVNGFLVRKDVESPVSLLAADIILAHKLDRAVVRQSIIYSINPDLHSRAVVSLCERAMKETW